MGINEEFQNFLVKSTYNSFTVKPVTQPAGYNGFLSIEGRVISEGGLYSRAGNSTKMSNFSQKLRENRQSGEFFCPKNAIS